MSSGVDIHKEGVFIHLFHGSAAACPYWLIFWQLCLTALFILITKLFSANCVSDLSIFHNSYIGKFQLSGVHNTEFCLGDAQCVPENFNMHHVTQY